jgi:hypothetical protein
MKALPEVDIELPAGQSRGFSLTGQLDGHSALIHVLQTENGKTVGGLGVLVLAEEN